MHFHQPNQSPSLVASTRMISLGVLHAHMARIELLSQDFRLSADETEVICKKPSYHWNVASLVVSVPDIIWFV